jgi:hypothetical protein
MPKHRMALDDMERAVITLIEHRSLKKAAAAAGVHAVTLWRWLKLPHFREQLREAQHQVYSNELARLQRLASTAVSVLEELLNDPETPPSTRFRVAEYVLEQSKKPFAIDEILLDDSETGDVLLNNPSRTEQTNPTAEPPEWTHHPAAREGASQNHAQTHNTDSI